MALMSSQMANLLNLHLAFKLLNNGCVIANNIAWAGQLTSYHVN